MSFEAASLAFSRSSVNHDFVNINYRMFTGGVAFRVFVFHMQKIAAFTMIPNMALFLCGMIMCFVHEVL